MQGKSQRLNARLNVIRASGNRNIDRPISLSSLFWYIHHNNHFKNSLASYCGMCYKSHSLRKNVVQTSGIFGKREWP